MDEPPDRNTAQRNVWVWQPVIYSKISCSVRVMWLRSPGLDRETFNLALQSLQRQRRTERLAWLAAMTPQESPAPHAAPSAQTTQP